eukprot:CAMPEP_0172500654 /NCGR_PEP_ID=MMETSP1066-20121228/141338_1 /TAXON_ID=671091 /ORGANISM="Coscinodiscus wailesii, Strain CCMP2513" /LENGTH=333 /DNA_ID=CAMNT_0013274993 /DNA_START=65 /DNA_END=1066 /DNA_ORIENTATION=-
MNQPYICLILLLITQSKTFSLSNNSFSLAKYQTARAKETSKVLDASRLHFQILLVDNNNFHGRIAEEIFARVAEYNDALFILYPVSATISSSSTAPLDAAAPETAVAICESLGSCSTHCTALGTSFDMSFVEECDLVIAMDDEVHSLIIRSLSVDDQNAYGPKCRLLSDFLSLDFCNVHGREKETGRNVLLNMLEPELRERSAPFYEKVKDSSSQVFATSTKWNHINEAHNIIDNSIAITNPTAWPMVEAAIIVASAGLTRFCLDTMDVQFESAFRSLLAQHFCRHEHLTMSYEEADAQLRKGSSHVTGYFSPEQRRIQIEQHLAALRLELEG